MQFRFIFTTFIYDIPINYNDSHSVAIIEGIGSTYGLKARIQPQPGIQSGYSWTLNSFKQNGQTLYSIDSLTSCESLTLASETFISLYPNPTFNQLTIHSSLFLANDHVKVSILNVLGQAISLPTPLQMRLESIEVDVSNLSPSIYFIQIKTATRSVVKMFVKE